jgi:hypothetical protein
MNVPNGTAWQGKIGEVSINGTVPADGQSADAALAFVSSYFGGAGGSGGGTVDTVNNVSPDSNKNVQLDGSKINVDDTATTKQTVKDAIEELKSLGEYIGSYDNAFTAQATGNTILPSNISQVTGKVPTINDFANVRADETHTGASTRYIISAITADGTITWNYDITLSTDITGKQDKLPSGYNANNGSVGYVQKFDSNGNAANTFIDAQVTETRGGVGGVQTTLRSYSPTTGLEKSNLYVLQDNPSRNGDYHRISLNYKERGTIGTTDNPTIRFSGGSNTADGNEGSPVPNANQKYMELDYDDNRGGDANYKVHLPKTHDAYNYSVFGYNKDIDAYLNIDKNGAVSWKSSTPPVADYVFDTYAEAEAAMQSQTTWLDGSLVQINADETYSPAVADFYMYHTADTTVSPALPKRLEFSFFADTKGSGADFDIVESVSYDKTAGSATVVLMNNQSHKYSVAEKLTDGTYIFHQGAFANGQTTYTFSYNASATTAHDIEIVDNQTTAGAIAGTSYKQYNTENIPTPSVLGVKDEANSVWSIDTDKNVIAPDYKESSITTVDVTTATSTKNVTSLSFSNVQIIEATAVATVFEIPDDPNTGYGDGIFRVRNGASGTLSFLYTRVDGGTAAYAMLDTDTSFDIYGGITVAYTADKRLLTFSKPVEIDTDEVQGQYFAGTIDETLSGVSRGLMADDVMQTLEKSANKTLSIDSTSTDVQYPSAKAVFDFQKVTDVQHSNGDSMLDAATKVAKQRLFTLSKQVTGQLEVDDVYFDGLQVNWADGSHNLEVGDRLQFDGENLGMTYCFIGTCGDLTQPTSFGNGKVLSAFLETASIPVDPAYMQLLIDTTITVADDNTDNHISLFCTDSTTDLSNASTGGHYLQAEQGSIARSAVGLPGEADETSLDAYLATKDAPNDGNGYIRENASWQKLPVVDVQKDDGTSIVNSATKIATLPNLDKLKVYGYLSMADVPTDLAPNVGDWIIAQSISDEYTHEGIFSKSINVVNYSNLTDYGTVKVAAAAGDTYLQTDGNPTKYPYANVGGATVTVGTGSTQEIIKITGQNGYDLSLSAPLVYPHSVGEAISVNFSTDGNPVITGANKLGFFQYNKLQGGSVNIAYKTYGGGDGLTPNTNYELDITYNKNTTILEYVTTDSNGRFSLTKNFSSFTADEEPLFIEAKPANGDGLKCLLLRVNSTATDVTLPPTGYYLDANYTWVPLNPDAQHIDHTFQTYTDAVAADKTAWQYGDTVKVQKDETRDGKPTAYVWTAGASTTLTADAAISDTAIQVSSTTGFKAGDSIMISNEAATIDTVTAPSTITLTSGLTAVHSSGATVKAADYLLFSFYYDNGTTIPKTYIYATYADALADIDTPAAIDWIKVQTDENNYGMPTLYQKETNITGAGVAISNGLADGATTITGSDYSNLAFINHAVGSYLRISASLGSTTYTDVQVTADDGSTLTFSPAISGSAYATSYYVNELQLEVLSLKFKYDKQAPTPITEVIQMTWSHGGKSFLMMRGDVSKKYSILASPMEGGGNVLINGTYDSGITTYDTPDDRQYAYFQICDYTTQYVSQTWVTLFNPNEEVLDYEPASYKSEYTVSSPAAIGDTTVTVSDATGAAVNDVVYANVSTVAGRNQAYIITGISGNTLTISPALTVALSNSAILASKTAEQKGLASDEAIDEHLKNAPEGTLDTILGFDSNGNVVMGEPSAPTKDQISNYKVLSDDGSTYYIGTTGNTYSADLAHTYYAVVGNGSTSSLKWAKCTVTDDTTTYKSAVISYTLQTDEVLKYIQETTQTDINATGSNVDWTQCVHEYYPDPEVASSSDFDLIERPFTSEGPGQTHVMLRGDTVGKYYCYSIQSNPNTYGGQNALVEPMTGTYNASRGLTNYTITNQPYGSYWIISTQNVTAGSTWSQLDETKIVKSAYEQQYDYTYNHLGGIDILNSTEVIKVSDTEYHMHSIYGLYTSLMQSAGIAASDIPYLKYYLVYTDSTATVHYAACTYSGDTTTGVITIIATVPSGGSFVGILESEESSAPTTPDYTKANRMFTYTAPVIPESLFAAQQQKGMLAMAYSTTADHYYTILDNAGTQLTDGVITTGQNSTLYVQAPAGSFTMAVYAGSSSTSQGALKWLFNIWNPTNLQDA